jgi:serine/threonine protein phosphatase PrpC
LISLHSWAQSDIGKKRKSNEDSFFASDSLRLYIVADGMGGHRGGDTASRLAVFSAVATFQDEINKKSQTSHALERALAISAQRVYEASNEDPELRGMGTTLSVLAISDDLAFIAHIGDSRVYCIRDQEICQVTRDHSLVYEQVLAGLMSAEEAKYSNLRNIITRAIGSKPLVDADFFSFELKDNDLFLLCTDGLNSMLSDAEICERVSEESKEDALNGLINHANMNGGDDNITAVLVQVEKS